MAKVLAGTRQFFFNTPQAEKERISIRNCPSAGRGYQRLMDNVTYGSVDLHEGVDILR